MTRVASVAAFVVGVCVMTIAVSAGDIAGCLVDLVWFALAAWLWQVKVTEVPA